MKEDENMNAYEECRRSKIHKTLLYQRLEGEKWTLFCEKVTKR